jgi:hypothetical protein
MICTYHVVDSIISLMMCTYHVVDSIISLMMCTYHVVDNIISLSINSGLAGTRRSSAATTLHLEERSYLISFSYITCLKKRQYVQSAYSRGAVFNKQVLHSVLNGMFLIFGPPL